jgi:prolyl oligopeptidase
MNHKNETSFIWVAIATIILLTAVYGVSSQTPTQPAAPVRAVTDEYFGQTIVDPYRWMETPNNTELSEWMKSQNAYTRAKLDASPHRAQFLKRVDELTNAYPLVSLLDKAGDSYFYLKILPGESDRKLYVRDGLAGAERLLVDPTKIADGGKRFSIIAFSPSQDGKFVSYLISAGGAEHGEIRVIETATGKDLGERIDRTRWEAGSWLPDGKSFLYVRSQQLPSDAPQTERYQKGRVFLHKLGDDPAGDRPVFGFGVNQKIDLDPKQLPFPYVPSGSKYALVTVGTGVSPNYESYAVPVEDLSKHEIPWRKLFAFEDEVSTSAVNGDDLYLLTYKNAPRFKIVKTSITNPDPKSAKLVVSGGEAILKGITATSEAIIVHQNDGGISKLLRVGFDDGKVENVDLPFVGTIYGITADQRGKELLFTTESWVRSSTIYSYDSKARTLAATPLQPPSGIDTSEFDTMQVKAKAADGTLIPLSIIFKKGIKLDGRNRTAMSGYGSYGISQEPFFLPAFLAWIERGNVLAFAHVRGGGEYGREWHLGGFQGTKPNTWNDFIACAEHLVREKYTSRGLLAAHGGSAGGILVGNAIATRPELFGAAIIQVGLNNMLRYETTANGVPNVPEFGSVKTEEGFKNLLAMDAFHKIKDGVKYPAVMLTHGINDPRVEPWFSAKLAARLQTASKGEKPILLRIDYDAGHGIGSSRRQKNEESADVLAFLTETLAAN